MQISELKPYSVGAVSANKERGSTKIYCTLRELNFTDTEEIINNPTNVEYQTATKNGNDANSITVTKSIQATWLPTDTNMQTAPDVRRGDMVRIWRLGSKDVYYWECLSNKQARLETKVWAINADPSAATKADYSNAYAFIVSSHDKTIALRTSTANGEYTAFTAQFDLAAGLFAVEDLLGNSAYIDSANTDVGLTNADGTIVQLNRENALISAKESVTIKTKQANIIADTTEISNVLNVGGATTIGGAANLNGGFAAEGSCTVAGSLKVNGRNVKLE